jgi:hypothetical protein
MLRKLLKVVELQLPIISNADLSVTVPFYQRPFGRDLLC